MPATSRLEGFYKRPLEARAECVADWAHWSEADRAAIASGGLTPELADTLIENVVGQFTLPLGVATNFLINGHDYLIPMATEEPSVIAGCSFAAKLVREGGGFTASADAPVMIAQLQVLDIGDLERAASRVLAAKSDLMEQADALHPSIVARGGGARDVEVRVLRETAVGSMLIVHLLYDVRDAMGANAVNTTAEALAPTIASLTGGRVLLRILSNLCDRRLARATGRLPIAALATAECDGQAVAEDIVAAWAFADADPYRAATHNKGVMNGVDAILLATGNDWRAAEAGTHAYATRSGRYRSVTTWRVERERVKSDKGNDAPALVGEITLPLALGTVGGTTSAHPVARAALKVLDVASAQELAGVVAAVGLAQNLAALRALATEGIQHGHMRLHARKQRSG